MEKEGKALTSSLIVTLELLILMLIGFVLVFFTSKIEPVLSSKALILKASSPFLIRDSRLDVLNDLPELATKIDSRIEVFPQPFLP